MRQDLPPSAPAPVAPAAPAAPVAPVTVSPAPVVMPAPARELPTPATGVFQAGGTGKFHLGFTMENDGKWWISSSFTEQKGDTLSNTVDFSGIRLKSTVISW